MAERKTVGDGLAARGISRRGLLKYTAYLASAMALPPLASRAMAQALADAPRQSVIWLSFQECTGCTESLTRSYSPTIEDMIFDLISLDYHETLMAASGFAAEEAMEAAIADNKGKYLVIVDGSVSTLDDGVYSTNAGKTNLQTLKEVCADAAAVISVGSCAAFGGIPHARPNPTGAVPISDIITDKPVINIPGCPPIPEAIAGTAAYFVTFGRLPDLDHLNRPKAFFGDSIHDRCYRRPFYDQGKFAHSFDDEGARNGWCLYELGCKGPVTYNACATMKWNGGTSFPIQSGHGCLGCSEPDFWDRGGFYQPLSSAVMGDRTLIGGAALAGLVAGGASALRARKRRADAAKATQSAPGKEETRS
ncbi:hydrogenase small subunit [Mesobacterium sp. TK19101]|uniref:hydrogenase (acceptor) n=1 Tax=Mesobacterium hydrothermale TaxID=3111907 RepID=A0ABU6HKF9_9RHOB|nr:hydrogenase small subunit [Mesobacterium sp. TK19101]MEC3862771.1 hydrogenase small subunit [Mesobacterium sp. TK19101]